MEKKRESGLLSLEASISVTIFIFLMLFMYSFFVVFEVRNEMAHVTLSTTNSLALDAYANKELGDSDTVANLIYNFYGRKKQGDSDFTDYRQWYDAASDAELPPEGAFAEAVKTRFLAYLTNGESESAEEMLERYHIEGGVDGLDFTGSHISGEDLFVTVKYTLKYEFNVFGLGTIDMSHSACSKLWKNKGG